MKNRRNKKKLTSKTFRGDTKKIDVLLARDSRKNPKKEIIWQESAVELCGEKKNNVSQEISALKQDEDLCCGLNFFECFYDILHFCDF